jgi:peptidoglycan biosynthesis protein MviN/MurJ (putative lipid II flippase)
MSSFQKRFGILFVLSTLGYMLSFGSQLIIAYYFGTSNTLDSYWALLALVNFLVFYVHPFREALVPPIQSSANVDLKGACALFSAGLVIMIIMSVGSSAVFMMAAASGLAHLDLDASRPWTLKGGLLAYLLVIGLAETCNGLLLSFNRVLLQATARLISALIGLICLWILAEPLGVFALILSLLVSYSVTLFVSLVSLRNERIDWVWLGFSPLLKNSRFRSIFATLIFAYFLAQIYSVSERFVMKGLTPGLLASYQYSVSLVGALISLTAYPVANLLWPYFLVNSSDIGQRNSFNVAIKTCGLLLFLMMIISVFVYWNARDVVFIIYGRGNFSESSVSLTASTLRATIFASIPIGLGAILGRWIISQEYASKQVWVSLCTTFVGLFIVLIAYTFDSPDLIIWHWFLGGLVGFVAVVAIFLYYANYSLAQLFTGFSWITRMVIVVIISISVMPEFNFGENKILVFAELCVEGGFYMALLAILSWISGIGKSTLAMLRNES